MFRRPDITRYNIMLMIGLYFSYYFREDSEKFELCVTFVILDSNKVIFCRNT